MNEKATYEDFIKGLTPFEEEFVRPMHEYLIKKGYTLELKLASQGYVASYLTPKPKRTIFNYVFRKSGMQVRIYGDFASVYQDFLQTIPDEMVMAIEKAVSCRECNSRCSKGYYAKIKDKESYKCRYSAFMFGLTLETKPFIRTFIEKEITEREKH